MVDEQKGAIFMHIVDAEIQTPHPNLEKNDLIQSNQSQILKDKKIITGDSSIRGTNHYHIHSEDIHFKIQRKKRDDKPESIIYFEKERKGIITSLFGYLRDCLVFYLPIKKLFKPIRKFLYGREIDYVFFIHPRRAEDYYLGLPIIDFIRKWLPKNLFYFIISKMPPVVVSNIVNNRSNGVVLSSLMLPEIIIKKRKQSLESALKSIKFCRKITKEGRFVVGLGAWWPIVSHRGLSLHSSINDENVVITNGHMGTLLSIYLMIEKIAFLGKIDISELKIIVFGAGKMGANVVNALNGKVKLISLFDINKKNIDSTIANLYNNDSSNKTQIQSFVKEDHDSLYEILNGHHIGICVTSNLNIIIEPHEIPDHFIFIDDSRPEAISRKGDPQKILVLEGGLMKIDESRTNYNYGFGIDQNVFGCLAETYALSINQNNIISSTLGAVELSKFDIAKAYFEENKIEVGDFKVGEKLIDPAIISRFIQARHLAINKMENQYAFDF